MLNQHIVGKRLIHATKHYKDNHLQIVELPIEYHLISHVQSISEWVHVFVRMYTWALSYYFNTNSLK